MTPSPPRRLLRGASRSFALMHLAVIAVWLGVLRPLGDGVGYLGLVHSLALYLFLPLPATLAIALFLKRRALIAGALAATGVFLWFFGPVFSLVPASARAGAPTLTVMTYNALGSNFQVREVVEAVRAERADVVLLQELNPAQALALGGELGEEYPHRRLDPMPGVRGMGVLSRYPLSPGEEAFPSSWRCRNQVLDLDWEGRRVTLVNFHLLPHPETLESGGRVARAYRERELEAARLAELAVRAGERGPVIAAGDANVTSTNRAYGILTRDLKDAWREAGFGFGHTFPQVGPKDYDRMRLGGIPIPDWLVRIDYVFHTDDLETVEVRTARSAGGSDHRGVVATLVLDPGED